jgi:hypothetical protein
VLASPREGQIKPIPTRDLRDDALALLSLLERDAPLRQYRYSLKVRSPDGVVQDRGAGRLVCAFGGTTVRAKAGPGFRALTTSSMISLDDSSCRGLHPTQPHLI